MVSILAVGEVVGGQICAGENDLVVDAVELDMLKAPAFVDALGDEPFAQTGQVGGVVHSNFHAVGERGEKRGKKRGTGWGWVLSCAPQGVCEDGYFELWGLSESIVDCGDELMLCLANVEGGEVDSLLCLPDLLLQGLIEFFRSFQDLNLVRSDVNPGRDLVKLRGKCCQR